MKNTRLACALLLLSGGCNDGGLEPGHAPRDASTGDAGEDGGDDPLAPVTFEFDFTEGDQGFAAAFADYPASGTGYDFESGIRPLPAPLDARRRGFLVAGDNHSDDLFMFLRRRVEGLQPGWTYDVAFRATFASDAPPSCPGVGGAPGEAVIVKAGAVPFEPTVSADPRGFVRINVDKGNQSSSGTQAVAIGNVAVAGADCSHRVYGEKTLASTTGGLRAVASADGSLWVLVGTDSGYEGRTALYYERLRLELHRR